MHLQKFIFCAKRILNYSAKEKCRQPTNSCHSTPQHRLFTQQCHLHLPASTFLQVFRAFSRFFLFRSTPARSPSSALSLGGSNSKLSSLFHGFLPQSTSNSPFISALLLALPLLSFVRDSKVLHLG